MEIFETGAFAIGAALCATILAIHVAFSQKPNSTFFVLVCALGAGALLTFGFSDFAQYIATAIAAAG